MSKSVKDNWGTSLELWADVTSKWDGIERRRHTTDHRVRIQKLQQEWETKSRNKPAGESKQPPRQPVIRKKP